MVTGRVEQASGLYAGVLAAIVRGCEALLEAIDYESGIRSTVNRHNHSGPPKKVNEFISETDSRQKNVMWPGPVVNASKVDAFLWHGSANPTFVQRIGAWIFGGQFLVVGLVLLWIAIHDSRFTADTTGRFFLSLLSLGALSLGVRIFRNGFPKRSAASGADQRNH